MTWYARRNGLELLDGLLILIAENPVAKTVIAGGIGAGTAAVTGGDPLAGAVGGISGAVATRRRTDVAEARVEELIDKYPPGARIADTPRNRLSGLARQTLRGAPILEVPVFLKDVPEDILTLAHNVGVTVRDITGKIYP